MVLLRRIQLSLFLTAFIVLNLAASSRAADDDDDDDVPKNNSSKIADVERKYKVFPIFNVVNFKNTACPSQTLFATGTNTPRNGTCFTTSECSQKGGTSSGNCASGFGVCCVFQVSTSGSTISQNNTYIQNPGFPTALTTTTSAVTYTINKCSPNVCWIRLDFASFSINGPSSSFEATGGKCDTDTLTITTTTSQRVPIICGVNTGQHIYVDIGAVATDSITLMFALSNTITTLTNSRSWDIAESQIECTNLNRPPSGCLQYFTTDTGRIMTFNFNPTAAAGAIFQHLAQQEYSVCIRRESGFCCVEYQVCADTIFAATAFTLDQTVLAATTATDNGCASDYIGIQASSGVCSANNVAFSGKYCGNMLNQIAAIALNIPICDCTPEFFVHVHTDNAAVAASEGAATVAAPNRGVCLDYMQVPCTTN
jgi:hypothetical protein